MNFELSKTLRLATAVATASLALSAFALPPGTDDEISERIRPIGMVMTTEPAVVASNAAPAAPRGGEAVYNSYCTACHANGVAGAPLFGNEEAWEPRIAKGMDALYTSTYEGLNGVMPVRGTCMDCSDEELRATVDYMVAAAEG